MILLVMRYKGSKVLNLWVRRKNIELRFSVCFVLVGEGSYFKVLVVVNFRE